MAGIGSINLTGFADVICEEIRHLHEGIDLLERVHKQLLNKSAVESETVNQILKYFEESGDVTE